MSILLSLTNSIYPIYTSFIYTRPLHFGQIFPNLVYCIRNRTKGIRQFVEIFFYARTCCIYTYEITTTVKLYKKSH